MKMLFCRLDGQNGHDAGRALLAQLYREETGKDLPPIHISSRGHPHFAKDHHYFSISHTPRHAFCVLSDRPVGIDAEELDRTVCMSLARRILSPEECAQFECAPDPRRALLTFWVLKEAEAKCSGQGLQGFPNHTHFSLDDPRVMEIDGCLVAVYTEDDHAV